jgi:hypothetical protein
MFGFRKILQTLSEMRCEAEKRDKDLSNKIDKLQMSVDKLVAASLPKPGVAGEVLLGKPQPQK